MGTQKYPPYGDLDEPGTPSWVGLSSPDVDASKRFYGDLFGWSADSDPRPDAGGYSMFKQDGLNVARLGPSQPGSPPAWTCYVMMPDADQTAAAVERAGGSVLLPWTSSTSGAWASSPTRRAQ